MIKANKMVNKFTSLTKFLSSLDVGESAVLQEVLFTNNSVKQACTRLKRRGMVFKTRVGVSDTMVTRVQ